MDDALVMKMVVMWTAVSRNQTLTRAKPPLPTNQPYDTKNLTRLTPHNSHNSILRRDPTRTKTNPNVQNTQHEDQQVPSPKCHLQQVDIQEVYAIVHEDKWTNHQPSLNSYHHHLPLRSSGTPVESVPLEGRGPLWGLRGHT